MRVTGVGRVVGRGRVSLLRATAWADDSLPVDDAIRSFREAFGNVQRETGSVHRMT